MKLVDGALYRRSCRGLRQSNFLLLSRSILPRFIDTPEKTLSCQCQHNHIDIISDLTDPLTMDPVSFTGFEDTPVELFPAAKDN
jgi:hypothetical protein